MDLEPVDVTDADDAFFAALLAADRPSLEAILADDFVIIDVMSGGVTERDVLLDALGSGALRFLEIDRDRNAITLRRRADATVVIGRTRMTMSFGDTTTTVLSRYAHTFVSDSGRWRLLTAQGTPIIES